MEYLKPLLTPGIPLLCAFAFCTCPLWGGDEGDIGEDCDPPASLSASFPSEPQCLPLSLVVTGQTANVTVHPVTCGVSQLSIEPQTITQAGTHTATVKLRYTPPGAEDLSAELEYPITVNTIYFLRDGAEDPKNRIEHKHSESWLATDPPGLVKEGSSNKSGLMGYTYQPAETDQCNAKYKARFIARAELQYQISWSREHSSHYAEAAVAHFVPISGAEGSPIMGGRAFTSITPVDPHATATLGVSAGVVGTFDFPLNSQPSLSFYGMNTVPMSVPVEMENYEQHSGVHPILYHKSAVANVGAYVRRCADTTRVIAIGTSILTSQAVQGEGDDEFLSVFEFIPVE